MPDFPFTRQESRKGQSMLVVDELFSVGVVRGLAGLCAGARESPRVCKGGGLRWKHAAAPRYERGAFVPAFAQDRVF